MWDIIGHERAVQALQHSISTGHVAHAYLFAGPPQIGKTTLALTLAQALNCAADAPPCGRCSSCGKIQRGTHPDVQLVAPLEDRLQHAPGRAEAEPAGRRKRIRQDLIAIDDIRDMQRSVALAPLEGRVKVVIIAGADRMTVEAANALLKTLEEPPDRVVLALTTTDVGLLLPTIVSRCQVVPLARLSRQQVEAALQERWDTEPAQAHLLAALSGGRLGWAVAAHQDEAILTERAAHIASLTRALEAGPAERLDLAGDLGQQRAPAIAMLHTWLAWVRDMWLIALDCPDRIVNIDHAPALQAQAQRVGAPAARSLLLALQGTLSQLDQNVNPRLALEVLLLNMP